MHESHFFLEFFTCSLKRRSDVASFVDHPVYSIFKMYSVLILVFYFDLPLFTQKACVKVTYFWNFWCSAKEAVLLLCSWNTLHVAFPKCKVSLFYFFYFSLPLLTESVYVKANFPWNFRCSSKEAVILLLSWSTLYIAFSKCIVRWF